MPRSTAPEAAFLKDREALLREMADLRTLILARPEAACPDGGERLLAVLRILPEMPSEEWSGIVEAHGLREWIALPLSQEEHPLLDQLARNLEELSYQSEHDPLTGLYNRRVFNLVLDHELERARRSRTSLSLALLDLDDFKKVNDTHGHPHGDQVLVETARVLVTGIRRYDVAARFGGEEFALLFPETGLSQAGRIVERILDAMRGLRVPVKEPGGPASRTTCSAGLVCYKGRGEPSPGGLLAQADKALYLAKERGKDRVVAAPLADLYSPSCATLVESSEKRFLFTGG
jgi:diguanylate cyclase (GGDEF)-like protein